MRVFLAILLGGAVGLFAGDARADRALAEALFDEGRRLAAAGKFAEACPKFERSNAEDPAPGTQLNLASCYEHLGKTASAWATYTAVASAASGARATFAQQKADALVPMLAKLTIRASSARTVTRDGAVVPAASFGVAIPVDPGAHVVVASGFQRSVTVAPGATVVVTVP